MSDVIEEIKREAEKAEAETEKSYGESLQSLRESAKKAIEETEESGRVAKVSAFGMFGGPLSELRGQIAVERRRQYLPGYKSEALGGLRAERERLKAERETGLGGITGKVTEYVGEIGGELAKGEVELGEQRTKSLREIKEERI